MILLRTELLCFVLRTELLCFVPLMHRKCHDQRMKEDRQEIMLTLNYRILGVERKYSQLSEQKQYVYKVWNNQKDTVFLVSNTGC